MFVIRCETGEDVVVDAPTLRGAKLCGLNLHRALLDNQDLSGADLTDSELRSAWILGAKFDGGDLRRASFAAANGANATFVKADLRGAMLRSAGFEGADFTDANLCDAKIGGATFKCARLIGADMRCQGIERAELLGAIASATTQWPPGFDPAMHGVVIEHTEPTT